MIDGELASGLPDSTGKTHLDDVHSRQYILACKTVSTCDDWQSFPAELNRIRETAPNEGSSAANGSIVVLHRIASTKAFRNEQIGMATANHSPGRLHAT
jgi:hypothetical protein